MNKELMFSSKNMKMETPPEVFDPLNKIFRFTLDVAASKKNSLCKRYFDEKKDALKQKWRGRCFMNPPYGLALKKWVEYAFNEAQQPYCGCVVGVLPGRIGNNWYQDYVKNKALIVELRGRVFFKYKGEYLFDKHGRKMPAAFPTVIAIWLKQDFHKIKLNETPDK